MKRNLPDPSKFPNAPQQPPLASEVYFDQDAGGENGPEFNLLKTLSSHKRLVILCTVLGGALGYLAFLKTPPKFASSAQLLMVHTAPIIGVNGLNEMVSKRDPIDTQVVLLKSPIILDKAVSKLELLKSQNNDQKPYGSIHSGLSVQRNEKSEEVINLSFVDRDPETSRQALESILLAYVEYLGESQETSALRTLKLITEAKDGLLKSLSEKEAEYGRFREQTPLLLAGAEDRNIHAGRWAEIESKRSQLLLEKTLLESQLKSIRALVGRGESREAIMLMIDQIERDAKTLTSDQRLSISETLMPIILEEQILLERFGTGHPKVREMQRRIEVTRSLLKDQNASDAAAPANPKADLLSVFVDSIQHKVAMQDEQLSQLNTLFTQEESAAKKLAAEENKSRALRDDIDRTKQLFETVLAKLQSVELTKDTGTLSVETIVSPTRGYQVEPNLMTYTVLGSLGGALFALLVGAMIELSDRGFQSPNDIARHMGAPVIGHLEGLNLKRERRLAGKNRHLDPSLVTFHRPSSGIAESFRNMRTALLMGISGQQQIIQVTSANPSDGKSTLTSNLAVTIARSGKRCLLIDCDFRRPRINKLFGLSNDVGMSSVLTGKVELPDAIQPGPLENLDLLTSGPKVKNPAELLLSPQFSQLLTVLRDRYEIVLVDSPPMLAVSDPATIAATVDGVVLVIRVDRNSRPVLSRVSDALGVVGANLIGVVVNGVNAGPSKFNNGYGRYSPDGYGSRYGYQYGSYGKYYSKAYSQYHEEAHVGKEENGHAT